MPRSCYAKALKNVELEKSQSIVVPREDEKPLGKLNKALFGKAFQIKHTESSTKHFSGKLFR
jgi:hypothetical protein